MAHPALHVVHDPVDLAETGARWVHDRAWAGVQGSGRFTLALSGGSTPKALYERLASGPRLPWNQMELCFGDERPVPPDDPQSNARMVREALTAHAFVPPERVHRIEGELPPAEAAARYEKTLRGIFAGTTSFPRFDLVLLGLGADGHTASLFPHSPALSEQKAWVVANWVEKFGTHRITLTYPVLNHAAELLFLVSGSDKRWALNQVLQGGARVEDVPARGIRPVAGRVTFLVDRDAAAGLGQSAG